MRPDEVDVTHSYAPVEPGAEAPMPGGDSLSSLASPVPPLSPDAPTMEAYDAFSSNPTLYAIAVVGTDGRSVGILNRFRFLERLSRPFGRDLLRHQPVERIMDANPLVVDERVSLDELSAILLDDASQCIFDGFVVTRLGAYVGLGTGYALVRALTQRKEAALLHMAHHDSLTGAPNRKLFGDRLCEALAGARERGGLVGLLYLDVDRLKVLNNNLGHAVGDAVLKEFIARIRAELRTGDTVARLSGDEFAAILPNLLDPATAETVAARVLHALRASYVVAAHNFNVSCSIGVAVYPSDAGAAESLQRAADLALYEAKQFAIPCNASRLESSGRTRRPCSPTPRSGVRSTSRESTYTTSHRFARARGKSWGSRRWCAGTRRTASARPAISSGSPRTPVSSRASPTGCWLMLFQQSLPGSSSTGCSTCLLAVNVSSIELRDGTLAAMIARHLEATGFPADALELEITETTAMLSGSSATSTLNALRALGVRVSVDDFGTGYSSLSRLQRLPVNAVKIDRAFVDGIDGGDAGALAHAIILMGHSLGLTVTGEGVESEGQLHFLESRGCDLLQGFRVARPMASTECYRWLTGAQDGADADRVCRAG